MYKITICDQNLCPIVTGEANFFVNNREDFESLWVSKKRTKKELRVQYDENALILKKRQYVFKDKTFELYNFYGWETVVYAKSMVINICCIRFCGEDYWVGKYMLSGVCIEDFLHSKNGDRWRECTVWGNPIHKQKCSCYDPWKDSKGRWREDYPKEYFAESTIETCCWVQLVGNYSDILEKSDTENLSNKIIADLMRDIPGQAG